MSLGWTRTVCRAELEDAGSFGLSICGLCSKHSSTKTRIKGVGEGFARGHSDGLLAGCRRAWGRTDAAAAD